MLNDTAIMGRLTDDPELRRTSTGTPVCSFTPVFPESAPLTRLNTRCSPSAERSLVK